jgi:flagellar biosynthesis component FlhA
MTLVLEPDTTRKLIASVRAFIESWSGAGDPVLLVPPLARGPIRRLLEKALPRLAVLSPGEIVPGTAIERVGEITLVPLKNGSR